MTVKRYDFELYHSNGGEMLAFPDGGYVDYEDYAELQRQLTAYEATVTNLEAQVQGLAAEIKFPGVMRCSTCNFSRSHVVVTADGMKASESEPEHCPNGCGPLWHDTYRRQYNELYDAYKALEDSPLAVKLPPHKYRECVNGLLEEAIAYAGTQQLRSRLSARLSNFVKPDHAAGGTVEGE